MPPLTTAEKMYFLLLKYLESTKTRKICGTNKRRCMRAHTHVHVHKHVRKHIGTSSHTERDNKHSCTYTYTKVSRHINICTDDNNSKHF